MNPAVTALPCASMHLRARRHRDARADRLHLSAGDDDRRVGQRRLRAGSVDERVRHARRGLPPRPAPGPAMRERGERRQRGRGDRGAVARGRASSARHRRRAAWPGRRARSRSRARRRARDRRRAARRCTRALRERTSLSGSSLQTTTSARFPACSVPTWSSMPSSHAGFAVSHRSASFSSSFTPAARPAASALPAAWFRICPAIGESECTAARPPASVIRARFSGMPS